MTMTMIFVPAKSREADDVFETVGHAHVQLDDFFLRHDDQKSARRNRRRRMKMQTHFLPVFCSASSARSLVMKPTE